MNFNVGDKVVDISAINSWRQHDFKQDELFLHASSLRVIAADEEHFILGHKYISRDFNDWTSVFVFSQVDGMSVLSDSKKIINLTQSINLFQPLLNKHIKLLNSISYQYANKTYPTNESRVILKAYRLAIIDLVDSNALIA